MNSNAKQNDIGKVGTLFAKEYSNKKEQEGNHMDYTNLLNQKSQKKSKVGIIGATRGYGYTLLAQIPKVQLMELRVICSRHPGECLDVLKEIGYNEERIVYCREDSQGCHYPGGR